MQEMSLSFKEAAIAVSAHGLHHAHVHVGVEVVHERFTRQIGILLEILEIVVEQFLPKRRRQIRLGIV